MFEIVFLGTAASAPSIQRGLSAQLIIYKEYRFLVDCGEGTQRQILKSGMGFRRLDRGNRAVEHALLRHRLIVVILQAVEMHDGSKLLIKKLGRDYDPTDKLAALRFLAEHAEVKSTDYTDSRVKFHCRVPRRFLHAIPQEDATVTLVNGSAHAAERVFSENGLE